MPPTVPINHYLSPRNQQNRTKVLSYYSMLKYSGRQACLKHSIFLKVKVPKNQKTQWSAKRQTEESRGQTRCTPIRAEPDDHDRNPTTSFLTATTLIYTIGAGITAAAGTRLALQLLLWKGFTFPSFQLQNKKCPVLLFLVTTSKLFSLGNLRACCLP